MHVDAEHLLSIADAARSRRLSTTDFAGPSALFNSAVSSFLLAALNRLVNGWIRSPMAAVISGYQVRADSVRVTRTERPSCGSAVFTTRPRGAARSIRPLTSSAPGR